jgi:hypothetical protein
MPMNLEKFLDLLNLFLGNKGLTVWTYESGKNMALRNLLLVHESGKIFGPS